MTTAKPKIRTSFILPDPPEHPDDKMTTFKQLAATGQAHHLAMHLGNPDTTIVSGELYVVIRPTRNMAGSHYPDLLVAFDADPALYDANNGYVISEQGKPPDFVLEIASRHTGHIDVGEKRRAYAAIGIGEYWRFDETGRYHGTRLAGDRLVGDRYEPVDIDELAADVLQGYSDTLHLHLRWEQGELGLYVPETGLHIATFASERARADAAEAERNAAVARIRQLEAELQRLRGE